MRRRLIILAGVLHVPLLLSCSPGHVLAQERATPAPRLTAATVAAAGAAVNGAGAIGSVGIELAYHERQSPLIHVLGAERAWIRYLGDSGSAERPGIIRYGLRAVLGNDGDGALPFLGVEIGRVSPTRHGSRLLLGVHGGAVAASFQGAELVGDGGVRVMAGMVAPLIRIGVRYPATGNRVKP